MSLKSRKIIFNKLLVYFPVLILFISVFNEFDFNYLNYKYFSFNFPFILIFYLSLKRVEFLGYGYIFIAGLFNDAVLGFPIGISSLTYLIICGFFFSHVLFDLSSPRRRAVYHMYHMFSVYSIIWRDVDL